MGLGETSIKAEQKYREAISLYAESGLSIKDICEQTGVGISAFSSYLSKHHRDLILKRHNLDTTRKNKLRGKRGQTTESHYKYKHAITACDSMEFIEYNISQIARIFNVGCSALLNQLRRHYCDIVPRREKVRRQMGIAVNLQYGARNWCKEEYAEAVEMLEYSDLTIEEVAETCKVSYTGLREHVIAYYPHITKQRMEKRMDATGRKLRGQRNGNWTIHEPGQETIQEYEQATELYRTTSLDVEEIACMANVSLGGFRYHLRTWHPELMVKRRGYEQNIALEQTKRYKQSTAEKYADAIQMMKSSDMPTTKVAAIFGLNPDIFRMYLKEHHPELTATRGMTKAENGKLVSQRSAEKYAEALHLYETTPQTLKSIAEKLNLTYNSLSAFICRNYPEAKQKHKQRSSQK